MNLVGMSSTQHQQLLLTVARLVKWTTCENCKIIVLPCWKCKILVFVLKIFHQRHLDAPMCPSLNRRLLSGWLIHSAVGISLINVSELYLATELSQIKIMKVMFHSCLNLMNYYSISYIMPFFLSYCRHISLEQLLQSPSGMMMV